MIAVRKLPVILGALLALSLASTLPARASHIFFENVQANGIDLFSNPGVIINAPGGVVTFSADVVTEPGQNGYNDQLDFLFTQASGTSATPLNQSFPFVSNDSLTQPFSFSRTFTGTFGGSVFVNIGGSFPDYTLPSSGGQVDSYTFDFGVQPVSNVPEPASMALLGLGVLPLLRRRRRGEA
jgi:MYXO-CTERM domain-containing protein